MTQEEINEGNKLINAFMGFPYNIKEYPDQIAYHTSWDWLMPVVEKIMELARVEMKNNSVAKSCVIYNRDYDNHGFEDFDSLIASTYKAVVEFIRWHNTQNK